MRNSKTAVALLISVLGVAVFFAAFFSLLNSDNNGTWTDVVFLAVGLVVFAIGAVMLAPQAMQNRYAKKNKKLKDDITANMALSRERERERK